MGPKVIRLVTVVDNGVGLSPCDDRCGNRDCIVDSEKVKVGNCPYFVEGSLRKLEEDFYRLGCRGGH